ncbi:hypothetical protein, partial [Pantoea ananatis]|uniref:hypothetical protein n=1 Tax=Pantoea ananas TaxID=553 RepID=UPI0023AF5DA3
SSLSSFLSDSARAGEIMPTAGTNKLVVIWRVIFFNGIITINPLTIVIQLIYPLAKEIIIPYANGNQLNNHYQLPEK